MICNEVSLDDLEILLKVVKDTSESAFNCPDDVIDDVFESPDVAVDDAIEDVTSSNSSCSYISFFLSGA